jgi:hypothetical protein
MLLGSGSGSIQGEVSHASSSFFNNFSSILSGRGIGSSPSSNKACLNLLNNFSVLDSAMLVGLMLQRWKERSKQEEIDQTWLSTALATGMRGAGAPVPGLSPGMGKVPCAFT